MELETVATFTNRLEADVAVARLQSEGIEAIAIGDAAHGMEPQLVLVRGVRVQVRPADAEDARVILGIDQPVDRFPVDPVRVEWVKRIAWWTLWAVLVAVVLGLLRVLGY